MNRVIKELAETELFKDVPDAILDLVAEQGVPFELKQGAVLLSPERENHHIYLILSGKLALHFGSLDSPEVRVLETGYSVGELSIIGQSLPSAYVVAKEPCRLFPIPRKFMQDLIAQTTPIASNLLKQLTLWLKENADYIVKDRSKIGELTHDANTDMLTGLYNRRWLDNAFSRLLTQAAETNAPLCIMLFDVDHFKKYNDLRGHLAGDQALIHIAKIVKTTLRPYDYAVRYGGEEFIILLPNATLEEAIIVAERTRLAIETQAITQSDGSKPSNITVSAGLALCFPDATPESLIKAADVKLYEAKQQGRNCIRF